ncbi:asparagine synthase-related protein, partial [Aestuariibaculum suncheonense]
SEINVAKTTAAELNVENIHYVIQPEEFLQELPKIIWHLDEPVADPAAVPLYFLAREARKHVTVVLSGEGADELFGGYTIYNEPRSL